MKKIVFILLIFCSFLVVWGCNKNKTLIPQHYYKIFFLST